MTLKDDLIELTDVLQLLPGQVNALGQMLHDLVEAGAGLMADAAALRHRLSEILGNVQSALPPLAVQVEALDRRVDAGADAVEQAWTDGTGQLTPAQEGVESAQDHLDAAAQELAKGLSAAAAMVEEAAAHGDAAVVEVRAAAEAAYGERWKATEAMRDRIDALTEILESVVPTLGEPAEDFRAAAEQFADNAGSDTDAILEHLKIRTTAYAEQMEDVVKEVAAESGENILVPFGTWVHDDVTAALGAAAEKLQVELDALAAAAAFQQRAAVSARDQHASALDDLKGEAEPLPRAVAEIHDAVQRMRQQ